MVRIRGVDSQSLVAHGGAAKQQHIEMFLIVFDMVFEA